MRKFLGALKNCGERFISERGKICIFKVTIVLMVLYKARDLDENVRMRMNVWKIKCEEG